MPAKVPARPASWDLGLPHVLMTARAPRAARGGVRDVARDVARSGAAGEPIPVVPVPVPVPGRARSRQECAARFEQLGSSAASV